MVVCVEEAELAPLAALDDDYGVQEVQDLGQIENVLNLSHASLVVVKSITDRVRQSKSLRGRSCTSTAPPAQGCREEQ